MITAHSPRQQAALNPCLDVTLSHSHSPAPCPATENTQVGLKPKTKIHACTHTTGVSNVDVGEFASSHSTISGKSRCRYVIPVHQAPLPEHGNSGCAIALSSTSKMQTRGWGQGAERGTGTDTPKMKGFQTNMKPSNNPPSLSTASSAD